jgi:hypothetical protein
VSQNRAKHRLITSDFNGKMLGLNNKNIYI